MRDDGGGSGQTGQEIQRAWPGGSAQVRIDVLPVIVPQLGGSSQRNQPTEVGHGANAREVMIAAKTGVACLMDQAKQNPGLGPLQGTLIEQGQVDSTARTEDCVGHLACRPGVE